MVYNKTFGQHQVNIYSQLFYFFESYQHKIFDEQSHS